MDSRSFVENSFAHGFVEYNTAYLFVKGTGRSIVLSAGSDVELFYQRLRGRKAFEVPFYSFSQLDQYAQILEVTGEIDCGEYLTIIRESDAQFSVLASGKQVAVVGLFDVLPAVYYALGKLGVNPWKS